MATTVEGVIENGQVRVPPDVRLPERAKVYIVIPDETHRAPYIGSPRLANPAQAADFRMEVTEEAPDAGV